MKTTDYKKGDVVLLGDSRRYEYLGEVPVAGYMSHAYRPLDGKTRYFAIKDAAGEFAPFSNKLAAEVVGLK